MLTNKEKRYLIEHVLQSLNEANVDYPEGADNLLNRGNKQGEVQNSLDNTHFSQMGRKFGIGVGAPLGMITARKLFDMYYKKYEKELKQCGDDVRCIDYVNSKYNKSKRSLEFRKLMATIGGASLGGVSGYHLGKMFDKKYEDYLNNSKRHIKLF